MNTEAPPPAGNNGAVARQWLDAGLQVFPCCPQTKKPLKKGWRALPGPDQLADLWERNSHAMPGLDCGGLVVVDCDIRPDRNGEVEFRSLCEQLGVRLDGVPRVRTPSGGMHFYFQVNPSSPMRNSAGRLAKGVDIRADGGFVIVAGATRADGFRTLSYSQTRWTTSSRP